MVLETCEEVRCFEIFQAPVGGLENWEDDENVQVGVLQVLNLQQKETWGFLRESATVQLRAEAGAVCDTELQLELTQGKMDKSQLYSDVASHSPSQHPFLLKRETWSLF